MEESSELPEVRLEAGQPGYVAQRAQEYGIDPENPYLRHAQQLEAMTGAL